MIKVVDVNKVKLPKMKINKMYKVLALLPILTLVISPVFVGLAQAQNGGPTPPPETPPISNIGQAETLMENILGWVNTFFYIFAALFVLIAAFQYLTARGDEEKVKKAKNMLIYAVIAIAVALFAGGLDMLIKNILSSQGAN